VLVAIGAGLRFAFLSEPAQLDESFSFLHYVTRPLADGLSDYSYPNNHLFNTLLTHVAWRLLGDDVWVMRLPAFIAGVALVPAAYVAARLLYDKHVALIAAGLVAGSSLLVEYSTNGRGYSLTTLFFIAGVALAAALAQRSSLALWGSFVLAWILAIYTVPYTAVGLAMVVAWILLLRRDTGAPSLRSLGLALAAIGAGCLLLYSPTFGDPGWGFDAPLTEGRLHFARRVVGQWSEGFSGVGKYVLLALAGIGLLRHSRLAAHRVPLVAACLPVIALVAITGPLPPFARVWLFLLPVYLITAAAGITYLIKRVAGERRLPAVSVAVVLLLSAGLAVNLGSVGPSYSETAPQGADDIARFLHARLRPGERAVVDLRDRDPIGFYVRRDELPVLLGGRIDPAQVVRGRVLVLAHSPAHALALARGAGLDAARPGRPQVAKAYRWITVYSVPVSAPRG
jgi:hypothetical protein